jgi:hypothetical protein
MGQDMTPGNISVSLTKGCEKDGRQESGSGYSRVDGLFAYHAHGASKVSPVEAEPSLTVNI